MGVPYDPEMQRLKDENAGLQEQFISLSHEYNKHRAESALRENEQKRKIKIISIGSLVIIGLLLIASFRFLYLLSSDDSIPEAEVAVKISEAKESGYKDGYQKGQSEGYDSGYDKGYEKGCDETDEKHYNDYNDGYNVGYRDGLNASAEEIQATLPDRYDEGYKAGKSDGYQHGYDAGKAAVSSYSAPSEPAGARASASAPEPEPQPQPQQETTPAVATYDYIINTNTGKFHYSWCKSVAKMSEKNKWYYTGTRDSVINMGYVPCKNCNP